MIAAIIRWSIQNRPLVLLAATMLFFSGIYAVKHTPVDAIPDLSDVQVIIKTSYPGQAPQVVEDQVTYPLSSAMLSVPGAVTVRAFSFYGDSYVYVIFDDDTDMYWARSRVLEYLNQVTPNLPKTAKPQLGPDASGVGWVYIYSLIDKSGNHDLSQLRSLQDWFLKYELQTVDGVSEVASVGGMVKQYQVIVDPEKIRAFNIPLQHIQSAIEQANQELGASVIELAEAEYMLRASGYIKNKNDLELIPLGLNINGTPLLLKDIARVELGPQMRRGIAELNGEGETVGGIIVMRYGENAQKTIDGVKNKLEQLKHSLPPGVEIVPVYDRSKLIQSAIKNLWQKLVEEFVIVALVCALFLFHLRSSLVAIISLPLGILAAFIVMKLQGINANLMSLGGIAIAIGAMIDGAIVMVENMHRHMEQQRGKKYEHWQLVLKSATEVGPALFFSLLIITVSFVPIFALEAQEGRMFSPLAFTKTYAMAAAAALAITLVPVLLGYFIRGSSIAENKNPMNRLLIYLYRPVLSAALTYPRVTVLAALLLLASSLWPLAQLGTEFMPELDEGDLMYMPTTYPSLSIGKAREILQQTDKLIATVPEVETVFGKIGRAETATDPAPLTMIETFIQLKPKDQWREGLTLEQLKQELDALVKFPGLSNSWVMPIKTRIDMLATGIKTPLGIKIAGPDIKVIQRLGQQLEQLLGSLHDTASVYSERVAGGRYLNIDIQREKAARFGLSINDIQQVIASAVGGINVSQSVEGLERYPINIRYPQAYRDSPRQLELLPIVTERGQHIALADVATIRIEDGPPAIKSENARINGWTYIDIHGNDIGAYIKQAQALIEQELDLPIAYSLNWAGQYEYMQRAKQRLSYIIPLTLMIIVVLLYMSFKSLIDVAVIMGTLPMAIVGSLWLLYLLNYSFSIAVAVGLVALAGVAVEIGVIMLVYIKQSLTRAKSTSDGELNKYEFKQAIFDGALLRIRPVFMTTAATIVGLLPIMFAHGSGSELMHRLAAPMVGGMLSALLLTLLLLPALYYLIYQPRTQHTPGNKP
ncbi:efflux RND transporter permease subunit [Agaribacterium haliotis]|uniref:efflux RND transporter permease subunit n=1 Tax=Agaribacterium haliotis TaxID=2013869 RepID=UPI000BB54A7F|nr:CusA/CzcA family heavy metal efflux RND transporter [Agaribacterium haliotis]